MALSKETLKVALEIGFGACAALYTVKLLPVAFPKLGFVGTTGSAICTGIITIVFATGTINAFEEGNKNELSAGLSLTPLCSVLTAMTSGFVFSCAETLCKVALDKFKS